jgi:hypothetical protein
MSAWRAALRRRRISEFGLNVDWRDNSPLERLGEKRPRLGTTKETPNRVVFAGVSFAVLAGGTWLKGT